MDEAVFDSNLHHLPRTRTIFSRLGEARTSHALAQGCAAATTAEAVTLAAAPPHPLPRGALRRCAHDDAQTSALPGTPVSAFSVPAPWGGAAYNVVKSVAVGPLAPALVAAGHATTASTHATVFGSPVGDTCAWLADVWVPRFRRSMAHLRRVAATDPQAAILTAHALAGPGTSAAHWLASASIPNGSPAFMHLVSIDREWVSLLLELGGFSSLGDADTLPPLEFSICWDRTFGVGGHCLGHSSASMSAASRWADGRARAWPTLARWAADMGADALTFARQLGAPDDVIANRSDPHPVDSFFCAASAAATAQHRTACLDAAHRVRDFPGTVNLARGAQLSMHSEANGHTNLLVHAVRSTASLLVPPGDLTPPEFRDHAGLILAMLYGLPVWSPLGMPRLTHCRHCLAAAPAEHDASLPRPAQRPSASVLRPSTRAVLDEFGRHPQVCNQSGAMAGTKFKHDTIARRLATISDECGRDGRYHDGPIFTFGAKRKPADFLQTALNRARFPRGEAVDPTFGLALVRSANLRESDKVEKYAAQLQLHPQLAFRAFGVTDDGDIGPQAHSIMAEWSRALAKRMAILRLPPADPRGEVSVAVSRAFVSATINQLVQWKLHERVLRMPRPSHR
jgi:hypothetical protein